jgi:hypothetical protein
MAAASWGGAAGPGTRHQARGQSRGGALGTWAEGAAGAPGTPARLARAGRPADQGGLVDADVPRSMERSVRSIPGLRSRSFADFRRGGRRGVFIAQACLKSRAPANYPRRGGASHDARWRRGERGPWNGGQAPMRLVDYVVAPQLVHLAHRKHTAGFWAALGAGDAGL